MKNQDELVDQTAALIRLGEKVLGTETETGNKKSLVSDIKFHDFRISALSFLSRVFGSESVYYQSFKTEVTQATLSRTRRGISMITAAQRELSSDWLDSTKGTISRDIQTDIMRLAQEHHEQGNNSAAVIIAGTMLEKLLRNLCIAKEVRTYNDIQGKAVAKKGLQLTGELYKKKVYERQDNKAIIGWLELTTAVAQEKQEALPDAEVKDMLKGIQGLINKLRY